MGCWNGTCGLTHLPIRAGEKVRAYILVPARYDYPHLYKERDQFPFAGAGITYSTDEFHPLSYGLKGEYNDYGGIEKVKKGANTKAILAYFNDKIKKEKLITYHPEDFKNDKKPLSKFVTIDELLHSVERSGLRDTKLPFGMVMFLESAVQAAIEAVDNKDVGNIRKVCRERKRKDILEYAENRKAIEEMPKGTEEDRLARAMRSLSEITLRDILGGGEASSINSNFAREYLNPAFLSHTDELVDGLTDHYMLATAMDVLRRTWVSQAGSGSQSEAWRAHRMMAEFVISHVGEQKKRHESDTNMDLPEEREYCNSLY